MEKIFNLVLMRMNSKVIECSCGEIMEIEEGKIDANFKDD